MTNSELELFCKSHPDILYLLKTTRAGEEVDNGCGIEFDLKPYAVITFSHDLKKIEDRKTENLFMNTVMVLTAQENPDSVKDMLERLADDGYEIIWTNASYKYPDEPMSEITKRGTSITFKVEREYALKVNYSELNKYYENRKDPSAHDTDLFNYLLSRNECHKDIVAKDRFLSDSAKLESTQFGAEGVTFLFTCSNGYQERIVERDWTFFSVSKEKSDKVQEQFEKGLFEELAKTLEERIKNI